MRFKHYVAFLYDRERGSFRFVTDINYKDKSFRYDTEKPALAMGLQSARDLVFGMGVNGYEAVIIEAPEWAEFWNYKTESEVTKDDNKTL